MRRRARRRRDGSGGRATSPIDLAIAAIAVLALGVPVAAASDVQPGPLHGPSGVSRSKVLVIGTDGTRWDLVRDLMAQGQAPNLASIRADGFATNTLLPYAPPLAFTMSAVGWSTIASGVGPAKHGVRGLFNSDPEQAGKHGYVDFLTRAERANPRLSTFSVSDWGNIGLHQSGGPIFDDAIDVKHAASVADTVPAYEAGDEQDADVAARYLRTGDPDAGYVYLGLVDETGHAVGSAGPDYRRAIVETDRRIGKLLDAIRARSTYARERWTVIVTTDHGHQAFDYGSPLIHGGGTLLERTSFVIASGPGVQHGETPTSVGVVDIAPTVLHQLRIPQDSAWNLDGRSFVRTAVPADPEPPAPPAPPVARGSLRGAARPRLVLTVGIVPGAPHLRDVRVTLPAGLRLHGGRAAVKARDNGHLMPAARTRATRGTITLRARAGSARRLSLRTRTGALSAGPRTRRALRHGGALAVRATAIETGGRTVPMTVGLRVRR